MADYYAVVRSDEYLAHYGVKGMKWRVRRAIQKGNKRAFDRYYKQATKKLRRLEKYANNETKYARKAVTKGAKAVAAGGMALAGITNPKVLLYKAGTAGYNAFRATNTKTAAQKLKAWQNEMNNTFDRDALLDVYYSKKKRHKRH